MQKNKINYLFIFLLVIGMVGAFSVFGSISMQKSDGVIINLAGRERMLTQKFNKEFIDYLNDRQLLATVKQYAKIATIQIKAYRKYYTKNVVGKIKKEFPSIKISAEYHKIKGAIPLPATFSREVSDSLGKASAFRFDLISRWNINKDKGLRDNFEQEAWDSLSRNSEIVYTNLVLTGTGAELRYATADLANVQACVSCHNSHPKTPKSDFKMNDLMGILIVSVPVTQDPVIAQTLLKLKNNNAQADYKYENTRKLFEITLKALRFGGVTFRDLNMTEPVTISGALDRDISAKLDKVNGLWGKMQTVVANIQEGEVNSPSYLKQMRRLRNLNVEVLREMNQAVAMFEAVSLGKVNKLQITMVVIIGIVLLVVVFIVMLMRDVVFQKRAEESEERYRSLAETAIDAIITADADGNIVSWNKGAKATFGFQEGEVLGKPLTMLMPSKYVDAHNKGIKQATETGKLNLAGKVVELYGLRKDKSEFPVELALGIFGTGKETFFSGIIRDITERKKIEAELAEKRVDLEKTIAQRTKELSKTLKEVENSNISLEHANRAKSMFLSSVSHELRTPMNSILGFTQLLESDTELQLTESQQDSVHQILKSGYHLLELINDILDLSKIESGDLSVSLEVLDIAFVITDVISLMQPIAEKHNITIINEMPEKENVYLIADLTRLKQALLNLFSNAIKYNKPAGNVVISLGKLDQKFVRINIKDTGRGIAEEDILNLFDPFNRLGAEGLDIEGSGIGLTITKKLIEVMGGRINVESEIGKGSLFYIELPMSEKPHVETEKLDKDRDLLNQQSKIKFKLLYVEDNPSNLKLMQTILLRRSDITMLSAPDATQGIELAVAHKPDIILMDINLPGIDGLEALKQLKSLQKTRGIPVLALSANAMEKDINRGKNAGFADYITKPINVSNFLQVIDKTLKG